MPPPPPPPPPKASPEASIGGLDGTDEREQSQADGQKPGERTEEGGFKLKFCTVCASNNNRYVTLEPASLV